MDRRRIPKQILQYTPRGRRSVGHEAKRWLETVADHMVLTLVWKIMRRRRWKKLLSRVKLPKLFINAVLLYGQIIGSVGSL
jgi:hypothetical protein